MPINYDKTIWVNDKTRLNESNLNHIEDGIEAVTNFANTLEEQMEHIPEFGIHVEEIDEKFYYRLDNQ